MKIKNRLLLLVTLFSLVSCNHETARSTGFRFRIDDSLARYDIVVCTRFLPGFKTKNLPMILTVLSPDGKRYRDTLTLPVLPDGKHGAVEISESGVWRDARWIYREGVTFPRKGLWVLTINHLSTRDDLNNISNFTVTLKDDKAQWGKIN